MKTLLRLWFLKSKANIRNLFKKPTIAIFTVCMVLLYGFIIISMFTIKRSPSPMMVTLDLHTSILVLIGFLALMLFSTLMSSKKALFYGNDAFFLFSGPFTRKQIMAYLTLQTIVQSVMIGFFALIFFVGMSSGLSFEPMFVWLLIIGVIFTILIFLVLSDYLYVLSIGDKKYNILSKVIIGIFVFIVMMTLIMTYLQTGELKTLFIDFIQSPLFYFVPVFGWLKLGLISYVTKEYLFVFIGFALLLLTYIIIYLLFINYQGDFYEQALQDSLDFSKRYKSLKEGNQNAMKDVKVKNVTGKFQSGAFAVMSKNFLLMKKTGHILSANDLITISIYIVLAIFTGLGFGFFIYMMVLYIFTSLQNSELATELKNYQIYLIPDKPIKKLIAVMLPTFIKVILIMTISLIIVGIYYQTDFITLIMYLINMIGYICVFMSGSVLTVRILKSRSSRIFENLMRMFIMVVCSLPSVFLTAFVLITGHLNTATLTLISYSSLFMNFVIAVGIIILCQDMMNGRELKSE